MRVAVAVQVLEVVQEASAQELNSQSLLVLLTLLPLVLVAHQSTVVVAHPETPEIVQPSLLLHPQAAVAAVLERQVETD